MLYSTTGTIEWCLLIIVGLEHLPSDHLAQLHWSPSSASLHLFIATKIYVSDLSSSLSSMAALNYRAVHLLATDSLLASRNSKDIDTSQDTQFLAVSLEGIHLSVELHAIALQDDPKQLHLHETMGHPHHRVRYQEGP